MTGGPLDGGPLNDSPLIGFDLDMTLIDSRPGIGAVYRALAAETGVHIDVDQVVAHLGPPLPDVLAEWFPLERVPEMTARYRELYPDLAIRNSPALPGAVEAIAAVHEAGGRVMVLTAKQTAGAALHLAHIGVTPDLLVGLAWSDGKRDALREHRAVAYVGDHAADVRAARNAPTISIGVTTGGATSAELVAAGADVVLADLREFPAWLEDSKLLGCRSDSR